MRRLVAMMDDDLHFDEGDVSAVVSDSPDVRLLDQAGKACLEQADALQQALVRVHGQTPPSGSPACSRRRARPRRRWGRRGRRGPPPADAVELGVAAPIATTESPGLLLGLGLRELEEIAGCCP